ncbi:TPA: helix-turn-helix transcriptional regulator [Klebsiella quasipneumoniae subsp. similipneumoniae]|nr:helix-turn-helix transcriptional regulator [Klebsiella quasipneumoniae subsp. similipneumoniae]
MYINKKDEEIHIKHGEIAVLEKNISFDVRFIRKNSGSLYRSIDLSDDILNTLRNVVEPIIKIPTEHYTLQRGLNDRIFKIKSCAVCIELFDKLFYKENNCLSSIYKLAYLISKCEHPLKFALSLYSSVAVSFREKLNRIIFTDTSKKWKLSDIADEIHLSEICVRKRLDSENINFNQLLLDARMYKAVKYLIKSDLQIGVVSSLVGYSSISYFIKTFKEYYGITPKQFEIGIKQNLLQSVA